MSDGSAALLSIGEFAALAGATIKQLRHYDKVGVLKPAYIDPITGYRYYQPWQQKIVLLIQVSLSAGITLREFDSYVSNGHETVRIGSLLERAETELQKEHDRIVQCMDKVNALKLDVEASSRRCETPFFQELEELDIWLFSQGSQHGSKPDEKEIQELAAEIASTDSRVEAFKSGVFAKDGTKRFYVRIYPDEQLAAKALGQIVHLPAGRYLCGAMRNDIDEYKVWAPEHVALDDIEWVMSVPAITWDYNVNNPQTTIYCRIKDPAS